MLMIVVQSLMAQHYVVNRSDFHAVDVTFTSAELQTKTVYENGGMYTKLTMDDAYPSTKVGYPELPMMSRLIEIPLCSAVNVRVVSADYRDVDAAELGAFNPVFPAQQSYPKSYVGAKSFAKDQTIYSKDAFYSAPLAHAEIVGVMRDVNMANIQVSPIAYNPVTNQYRIYSNIRVEVTFEDANVPATYEMKSKYGSPLFETASNAVINPSARNRNEFSGSRIKYLIIAHSMFANNENLNAFVNWKKRLGYVVEVAYTSDANVGTTTTSIKNFIQSRYDNATVENPAPTYLLLIGDHAQIPAHASTELNSHVTDLYYATLSGNDNIPDLYYGRFSATSIDQMTPQIEKSLTYEQYTMEDPSYLGNAVLIAGTDASWAPTHANGQVNYIFNNYINTNSTTHNYSTVYQHLYNCSGEAATIRAEIGAGCGWANYTAHGSEEGWADPTFSMSQVSQMNNANKYGVMIGNCCLTGKFNLDCFGETLLRTPNKGAVCYVGASEVSYWKEDYYWAVGLRSNVVSNPTYSSGALGAYDCMFHTHNEDYTNWVRTMSSMIHAGNLAVESSTSTMKRYYWEIYHLFGDPSIRPYLGVPATMTVNAPDVLAVGATSYQVIAAPYAYCALTYNNEIVGATFADANGNAIINFNALTTQGQYELACGAQNYIQFFKTVNVIVPEGPYVIASALDLAPNNLVINGNDVTFDLTLSNLGVSDASNITATLTSNSPLAVILNGTTSQSALTVNQSVTLNNAFTIHVATEAADATTLPLQVEVNWGAGTSTKMVNLTVAAPNLIMANHQIAPVSGATHIAPGDVLTVSVENKNNGHAPVIYALTDLTCNYSGVIVNTPSNPIYGLNAGATTITNYTVQVNPNVPDNSVIPMYHHIIMNGQHIIDTIYFTIGNTMEGFESGNMVEFGWTGSNLWEVTTTAPYAGTYCARSKTGLSHNQTSTMSISMTALMDGNISFFRKVSSESNYDKFIFYIDNEEKDTQSGSLDWSQVSFPVTAGYHTYKFTYSKDASVSNGSDCAWVDNIEFPGLGSMVTEDVQDPVAVEDYSQNRTAVYPNPTDGQLQVFNSQMMSRIELFDLSGRMLDAMNVNGTAATLNVSSYANGVYFVKVYAEDKTSSVTKFIKK